MKNFESFDDLMNNIKNKEGYKTYLENELSSFLECVGSDVAENANKEPEMIFIVEIEGRKYRISIKSIEENEDEYKDFY